MKLKKPVLDNPEEEQKIWEEYKKTGSVELRDYLMN